jgi:peptidoglycan/xylan/chitin deacetylase (PgdA/CDA1 family)
VDADSAAVVSALVQEGVSDGWEAGPNPVQQIIVRRTVEVGSVAGAGLITGALTLAPALLLPLTLAGGGAVTVGLSSYFSFTFYARSSFGFPLVTRLSQSATPSVALTFDDGPHPETTPALLDLLAQANARATFFLVGARVRAYPDLARRVSEAGHTIGVHGLHHRTMVLQSPREIARDLSEAERIFEDVTGKALSSRLLRPPYGFKTWTLCRTLHRLGWTTVSWSLDGRDYDRQTPERLAGRVNTHIQPGDIVLLHERPSDNTTLNALPTIFAYLHECGLSCVGFNEGLANPE